MTPASPPPVVIYHVKAYRGPGDFCEALRIDQGRITQTGPAADIREAAPPGTRRVDGGGRLVLPAFHDSHLHLFWLGHREGMIECAGAASLEEVVERGRALIARLSIPPGSYVQGAGLNPDLFTTGPRDVTREDLDRISREHPVIISRHCGHTVYCNTLALKMAGLAETAPDVEGGTIEKDAAGRPTGVFRENANALLRKPVPALTRAELKRDFRLAMEKALSFGVTAVGSYDTGGPDFDEVLGILRELYGEGGPCLRVSMQCGVSGKMGMLASYIRRGLVTGKVFVDSPESGAMLKMGAIKLFIDGTLGGQTAWMRRPYHDKAETSGFPVIDTGLFRELVKTADAAGAQVLVHAIGDAGVEEVIAAFEKVIPPAPPGPGERRANPRRHGVIHCQITGSDLLERMAKSGILALVQPVFMADDMPILESRVGAEVAASSYAWGSMERLGIVTAYGTDAPVCGLDPLQGIHWAVLREGFFPNERVDLPTAIDAYTAGAAYSAFDEKVLGRVAPGFFADLVFLDRDIFALPPEEIHLAKVRKTLLAGETVWERE